MHVAELHNRYNKLHITRKSLSLTKIGELKGWQRENTDVCTHSYLNTGFTSSLQNELLKRLLQTERHPKLESVLRALQPFTIPDQRNCFSSLVSLGQLLINSCLSHTRSNAIKQTSPAYLPKVCPGGRGVPGVGCSAGNFFGTEQPGGRCCCREMQVKMIPFSQCLLCW